MPRPFRPVPFCAAWRVHCIGAKLSTTGVVMGGSVRTPDALPTAADVAAIAAIVATWAADGAAGLKFIETDEALIESVEVFSLAEQHGPETTVFVDTPGGGGAMNFTAAAVELVLETNLRGKGNVGRIYFGVPPEGSAISTGFWSTASVTAVVTVFENLFTALTSGGFIPVLAKPQYGTSLNIVTIKGSETISYQTRRGTGRD